MNKILHLSNDYFNSTLYRELLTCLNTSDKFNSDMVVPLAWGKKFAQENNVFPVECFNAWDRYFYFKKQHLIQKHVTQTIDIPSYRLIHAHFLFTNGYTAYQWKKHYGIPYIVSVRNTDVNLFFKRLLPLRELGVRILRNADRVVFLNPSYKKNVLEQYIPRKYQDPIMSKCDVIPNGIHEFWLQNRATPRVLSNPERPRLVFAGDINKNKNILTTALACEELKKRGVIPTFYVAGTIQDNEVFQRLIAYDFVRYVGKLDQFQLRKLYLETDVFVMNSIYETFGLVYAEAMSQGLPVIYTKGQGFDGQFDEGVVGYHADCSDVEDIANRIMACIAQYEVLSRNCSLFCDQFDWGQIAKKYLDIYREVLTEQL